MKKIKDIFRSNKEKKKSKDSLLLQQSKSKDSLVV